VILRVIEVLGRLVARAERSDSFEGQAFGKCVEFFRFFADACHHAKEEDLLFPVLEARGIPRENGPIGMMLYEHGIARQLTQQMADALAEVDEHGDSATRRFLDAAHQYRDLLTQHIFKEDNVLFTMGDRVLRPDDQTQLCGKFCDVACRSFGGKKRAELEAIATELESQWPAG